MLKKLLRHVGIVVALAGLFAMVKCVVAADDLRIQRDIEYAAVGKQRLLLDLYLPPDVPLKNVQPPPLIVWIHGGAWRAGSKASMPWQSLVHKGFAIASIDYRLSTQARFPAQIHDAKAAIRFLRASADKFGYNAERIAVAGASAGGHLAALVGVTNGQPQLEGKLGDHTEVSSAVQAIVDLYGPTNFLTILPQSTPHGLSVRIPALKLLLGGPLDKTSELAELAGPVNHVDAHDPPLLILHGDQDPQVPINQSHELVGKYQSLKRPVEFVVLHGAAHGGAAFTEPANLQVIETFLEQHLKSHRK